MAMEYGIDMLAAASKVVLCENALKVQHVDDDFMVQLAISAFKTGKYSDLVLKYLCENYTGPTDELINLWHAADKFSISSMKLDERILEQVFIRRLSLKRYRISLWNTIKEPEMKS